MDIGKAPYLGLSVAVCTVEYSPQNNCPLWCVNSQLQRKRAQVLSRWREQRIFLLEANVMFSKVKTCSWYDRLFTSVFRCRSFLLCFPDFTTTLNIWTIYKSSWFSNVMINQVKTAGMIGLLVQSFGFSKRGILSWFQSFLMCFLEKVINFLCQLSGAPNGSFRVISVRET